MTGSDSAGSEGGTVSKDGVSDALQVLLDEREIRNVIVRYVHACDRLDEEELRTIYHPGAYDDHGPIAGPESSYIPAVLHALKTEYTLCSHVLGQTNFVSYAPDRACTETYVFAVTGRDVDGQEFLDMNGGRYIDRFERRDGEWRIADRVWVMDWDTRVERHRWMVPEEWSLGARGDRSDLSYFNPPAEPSSRT